MKMNTNTIYPVVVPLQREGVIDHEMMTLFAVIINHFIITFTKGFARFCSVIRGSLGLEERRTKASSLGNKEAVKQHNVHSNQYNI